MNASSLTRRSLLKGMITVGAGLLVAACSQGAPTSPTSAPSNSTTAPTSSSAAATPTTAASSNTAPSTSAAPASSNDKVTLNWWMASRGDDLLAFETSPKVYMQNHPNVTIQFSGDIAGAGGTGKIQAAIAAGNPPDLVQTSDYPGASGLYYQGGIPPLDDYIKAAKDFDIKSLEPATTAACRSYDGKQWALPDQLYVTSDFFFNPKMFEDKGLDPTKPPETLEQLEQVAEKFDVRNGSQLDAVGFHPASFVSAQVYPFAFGGKFWDPDKQKITPDDPGVVAGLEWLLAYYKKYGVDNLRRLQGGYGQYQSAQNPYLDGKVAMTGFWDALAAYRNRYAPNVPIDMAPFPYASAHPDAKGFGTIGFNPTFIPRGAKQKDIAWDVLKFNETDMNTVVQTSNLLANTPELLDATKSPVAEKADPVLKKCWTYAETGKMQIFPPPIPGNAQYSQEWKNQVDLILGGKSTVKDAMQKLIQVVQPEVDKGLHS